MYIFLKRVHIDSKKKKIFKIHTRNDYLLEIRGSKRP